MIKKVCFVIFCLIIIGTTFWMTNQSKSEGYVFSSDESEIWVIKIGDEDIKGKNQAEIKNILEDKASVSQGSFYRIPLFNQVANTNFKQGDKVKIYWYGEVIQTAPGRIVKTSLITKIKN